MKQTEIVQTIVYVKVTAPDTERDFEICGNIRNKLEKSTNLSFFCAWPWSWQCLFRGS